MWHCDTHVSKDNLYCHNYHGPLKHQLELSYFKSQITALLLYTLCTCLVQFKWMALAGECAGQGTWGAEYWGVDGLDGPDMIVMEVILISWRPGEPSNWWSEQWDDETQQRPDQREETGEAEVVGGFLIKMGIKWGLWKCFFISTSWPFVGILAQYWTPSFPQSTGLSLKSTRYPSNNHRPQVI